MITIILIFSIIALLLLEALVDGSTYKAWTTPEWKHYNKVVHRWQMILFVAIALFGKYLLPDLWSWDIILLVFGYIFMRFGAFDIIYMSITNTNKKSGASWFDGLTLKYPILDNYWIRLLGFILGVALIVILCLI